MLQAGDGDAAGWAGPITLGPGGPSELAAAFGATLTVGDVSSGPAGPGFLVVSGSVVLSGSADLGGSAPTPLGLARGAALRVDGSVSGYRSAGLDGSVGGSGVLAGDLVFAPDGRFAAAPSGPGGGLAVAGPVGLNGAALDLSLGYAPAVGDVLTLIDDTGPDPVAGTFAGLPEGAVFTPDGGGTYLRVSYAGGDGNDVTLTVLIVNRAPVLTAGNPDLGTTDEDTAVTISPGGFVNAGAGTTIVTDADMPADTRGIALTATTGRGAWSYSLDGVTFTPVGSVSESQALLLPGSALIRYQPDLENGETPTITYRAWDQSNGVAGTLADTTLNGLTFGFSTATDTGTLTVTDVNDAPTLAAGAAVGLSGTDEDTASSATPVSALFSPAGYSDVDTGAVAGIAVTGVAGRGTWQYSTDGATWVNFGPVSDSHALLLAADAQVRYLPDLLNGEVVGFSFRAWDQTSGAASSITTASYSDPGVGGGTTAFSVTSRDTQLAVTDLDDAPTDLALSPAAVPENEPIGTVVGAFTATDPDTTPQTFSYALVTGAGDTDNASFTVVGDQFVLAVSPDFEAQSSYTIRVRVTDQGGLSFEKALAVTVTDVNESPTDLALSPAAVPENVPAGTVVGTLSAADPDTTPQTFTYTLAAGAGDTDNGSFTIV
ncbi:MAG TPA: cadherin domain-containing protein, partial [Urbifossiella sp.]|nr:cadherin domain-containing protein [Urbifossiella sp.]